MLNVQEINQYYGSSHTLRGITMSVKQGECMALLGRNGVGKTTLLQCLMGVQSLLLCHESYHSLLECHAGEQGHVRRDALQGQTPMACACQTMLHSAIDRGSRPG